MDNERIDSLPWEKFNELKAEEAQIRKDVSTARGILNDALLRYIKKKANARNKKQAEDMNLLFADLAEYRNREDIRDAYGWDIISEKEMDRLMHLWDIREKYVSDSGKFEDRVTEMVTRAMNSIGEEYHDLFDQVAEMKDAARQREKEILQAEIDFERQRYLKGL